MRVILSCKIAKSILNTSLLTVPAYYPHSRRLCIMISLFLYWPSCYIHSSLWYSITDGRFTQSFFHTYTHMETISEPIWEMFALNDHYIHFNDFIKIVAIREVTIFWNGSCRKATTPWHNFAIAVNKSSKKHA